MKNEPLVLTFDIGTQSLRAIIFDKNGREVCFSKHKYETPYYSKNNFWAEQDPDFYFKKLGEVSRDLFNKFEGSKDNIVSVGITCIRDTCLCLDKELKPLRPIILWVDGRLTENECEINFLPNIALNLVGMKEVVKKQFRISKCNWIMENEKEIWEKTDKFVMLPTYINYLMTGKLIDSTANQIGHIPFDHKSRSWMKQSNLTRFTFNIPSDKLCNLVEPGEVIGKITKEVSAFTGIPEGIDLIATGSDKSCETLGLSVLDDNCAALSYGTTATIQFCTKKYVSPHSFFPGYVSVVPNYYNPEYQIFRGFWMLKWFRENFAKEETEEAKKLGVTPEKLLDNKLNDVPAGCDGLILLPFWSPGVENPFTKGAMVGFTDVVGKIHFYKAIIEGICLTLYNAMKRMEKRAKNDIKYIYLGGGGACSPIVAQLTADIFGLPVRRIHSSEPCSLGAAISCFVSSGIFSNYFDASKAMVHVKDEFSPDKNKEQIYRELYQNVYCGLEKKLNPVFKRIHTFSRSKK